METLLLIALATVGVLVAVGTVITLVSLRRAPQGYEDARGFHVTEPARGASEDSSICGAFAAH